MLYADSELLMRRPHTRKLQGSRLQRRHWSGWLTLRPPEMLLLRLQSRLQQGGSVSCGGQAHGV